MRFFVIIFTTFLFACVGFDTNHISKSNTDASINNTFEDNDANVELRDSSTTNITNDAGSKPKFVFEKSTKSPTFFDDFERPNNSVIGNGWTEKTDTFSLLNGGVLLDTQGGPADRVVRRTSGALDTEISGVVTIASAFNEISLFSRMQPDEVGNLVGYRAWFATTKMQIELRIKTSNGTGLYELGQVAIFPSLVVGSSYTFYMRTSGTDLVIVETGIFSIDEKEVQSLRGQDSSAYRILQAGQVGFGHREANENRWESFSMVEL